jgi:hypothetical protein
MGDGSGSYALGEIRSMALIQELQHRHVFRVAIAYCGLGWVILQLAHLIITLLNLQEWIMTTLLLIGAAGLPIVICVAWKFELTRSGIKRRENVQQGESLVQETRSTLNKLITAFLVLVLFLVFAENFLPLLG